MKNSLWQKSIPLLLITAFMLNIAASVVAPHFAYADPTPAQIDNAQKNRRSLDNLVDSITPRCSGWGLLEGIKVNCLILNLIWYLDKFLASTFLAMATYIFDISISYSLRDVAKSLFVTIGWGIVRDVTNLFFIFILLWIALATIFDIPRYGAKDLLFQFIVVALLINFSLAIGGFVINFTNALGKSFLKPLAPPQSAKSDCWAGTNLSCGISDKLLAFGYIHVATNQQLSATDIQAICDKAFPYKGVQGGVIVDYGAKQAYDNCLKNPGVAGAQIDDKIDAAIYQALWLLIIIPILSFIFFAAAIFFLVRYLMLSMLLVFAPIVFLFMILPDTRGFWSKWWDRLIHWSFFAPAFFFLLFLTVETFSQLTIANVGQGNNVKGFFSIGFDMILLIILMIMNLLIAQQMGIYGAGTVTKLGNRAAGWAGQQAKEAALRGAAPAARAVSESRVGRFLAATPVLSALTRPAIAIQEQREKMDQDRAKQIERAAAVSPDLALARLKGESMGVKAAYVKSANPENLRKLMAQMTPEDQESFVANLHANRTKYRINESELSKKIGEAMSKDASGLTLRVVAKTGIRSSDANFQNEVNKYLDGLNDKELSDALNPETITKNPHAAEYIVKNFRNDRRMGNAVLGTPEKIKRFRELAEAVAEQDPGYQQRKNQIPESQKTRVHLEYLRSLMEREGNPEGARALRYGPMINVISGAAIRPFVTDTERQRRGVGEGEGGEGAGGGGGAPPQGRQIITPAGAGEITQSEAEERERFRRTLGQQPPPQAPPPAPPERHTPPTF